MKAVRIPNDPQSKRKGVKIPTAASVQSFNEETTAAASLFLSKGTLSIRKASTGDSLSYNNTATATHEDCNVGNFNDIELRELLGEGMTEEGFVDQSFND